MGALRQDGLADETVGPNITWLDLTWAKKSPGEFLVEFRGSRVIEQEMAKRLNSGSQIRIPVKAWISLFILCLFFLSWGETKYT
jgi:hypothetical protein